MSRRTAQPRPSGILCVAGLVYFEVFVPTDGFEVAAGEEAFVEAIEVGAGGALNSASVARALGVGTTLAHPAGSGLTDAAVAHQIDALGIACERWSTDDDPAISLVRSADGERSFVSKAHFDALAQCPELGGFDWIHVPGLLEAAALDGVLRRARRAGATVSVAGSWAPRELERLAGAESRPWDLLVVNRHEARAAFGGSEDILADSEPIGPDLVITDDTCVHALIDHGRYRCEVEPVADPLDTTGAGDAFCAGYIASQLDGEPPDVSLRHAVDVASQVVQIRGGVPSTLNQP